MNIPTFLVEHCDEQLHSLASKGQIERIKTLCSILPTANKIAFEFSLDEIDTLDFHVNLLSTDYLSAFLFDIENYPHMQDQEWLPLKSFLKEWATKSSSLFQDIDELFFEFDSSENTVFQLPSVFCKVRSKNNKEEAFQLIRTVLTRLKNDTFFSSNEKLIHNCIFNAPANSSISHLGLMLSRPQELVRININNISTQNLCAFLEENGWKGNKLVLLKYFDLLSAVNDKVILSFDCHRNIILPRIGLEAFIKKTSFPDPRWNYALDKLAELGLCAPYKKEAVLKWRGDVPPHKTNLWHEDLVINSLFKNETSFSVLKRFPSHIKITVEHEVVKAKAYVGCGQTWLDQTKIKSQFRKRSSNESALDKAIQYVVRKQQQSGYWRDYSLICGVSDQWVTAYIGVVMNETHNLAAKEAAQKAWLRLKQSFDKENGWGYNFMMPADADSTAWGFILAKDLEDHEFLSENNGLLQKYIDHNQQLITYTDAASLKKWARLSPHKNIDGWLHENDCVLAAVARVLPIALPLLASKQKKDASWQSYWWSSNLYATAYSITAFKQYKKEIPNKKELLTYLKKEMDLYLRQIENAGNVNVFYLALLCICCIEVNEVNGVDDCVSYILTKQLEAGYWQGESEMVTKMPSLRVAENEKDQLVYNDQNHLFTTATVIKMLVKYHKTLKN